MSAATGSVARDLAIEIDPADAVGVSAILIGRIP